MAGNHLRRVVVTGLGAVSPLGIGAQRAWDKLLANACGIREVTDKLGDFSHNASRVAGIVPRGSMHDGKWDANDWLSSDEQRRLSRFMQYGQVAARIALENAKWRPESEPDRERTGVCLGSGIGAFEDIYANTLSYNEFGPKKISPFFVPRILINVGAGYIAMEHGFTGPNHAATTACTTGAHSIGDAARFIQMGDADVMVAGGAESCIHPLAFTGFERSKSLTTTSNADPAVASQPFARGRNGFVMAEGAAVLILEELQHALDRKATIWAELAGYGASADAHHLTHPPPDGSGALKAMKRALQSAGLTPSSLDYVNAHATSTQLGDLAEAIAIDNLVKNDLGSRRGRLLVSSTKGATGHLLGAAGALEALFTVLAVRSGIAPHTLNLRDHDPQLPTSLDFVSTAPREAKISVALSNSFGFGGTNASLCFTRYADKEYGSV